MQSSSLGTAPALRSFRLEAEAPGPASVVHWLILGVLLGTVLTTSVFGALFLLVASTSPDSLSLLRPWNGGGYAETPLEGVAANTSAAAGDASPVSAAAPPAETASGAATASQVSADPNSAAAAPSAASEVSVRPRLRTAGTITLRAQASSTAASLATLDS